jgi:hypothetical protein
MISSELLNYTPSHSFRNKPLSAFHNLFKHLLNEDSEKILKISINFEKSIFNYINSIICTKQISKIFHQLYINKCSHLFNHLNGSYHNSSLFNRLDFYNTSHISDLDEYSLIPYTQLAFLEPRLLFPEKFKLNFELYGSKIDHSIIPVQTIDYESATRCGKCKQHKVVCTTLQTRSADESESEFYFCVNCKNRWVKK